MKKNKVHIVSIRIQRDIERQVSAPSETSAIRKLKKALVKKGIKLNKRDFDQGCDNAYERY